MANKSVAGCVGQLFVIGFLGLFGCGIGTWSDNPNGGMIGLVIGVVLGIVLASKASGASKRERTCDICGSPIIKQGYTATINGKSFENVCAKCKNSLLAKVRKQKMKEICGD